ncbi:MAG TPA: hypothetical protein QF694_06405, partial [Dehalococcoidia bacterium]|nr:hypothetical protein [Dehalococcoidia bacterium]
LSNDKFGTHLRVIAHLSELQASQVRKFHKLLGDDDLATKPHCSIDNFCELDDVDAVKSALREIASQHRFFETSISSDELRIRSSGCV